MIFDAAIKVRDLETQYNITFPEDSSYETVGGFILNQLGFIPRGGESFEAYGYLFTVMDMDHRRVSRVKIKAVKPAETPEAKGSQRRQRRPRPPIPVRRRFRAAATKRNRESQARRQRRRSIRRDK